MPQNKNKFAHAFLCIKDIGSGTLKVLETSFGDLETAWLASDTAIHSSALSLQKKERIIATRKTIDVNKEWDTLLQNKTKLITLHDEEFPELLREIPDAPYTLYVRGSFDWAKRVPMMAIVGSRKHTKYGEQVAQELAKDLMRAGILVVSGMAFGIDSIAHKAVLNEDGETLAVLGNGVYDDAIHPATHLPLAKRIMENGAILSEYHPRAKAAPWTFPHRNRIVAGMTLGTIVIEANEKSGSLITADLALQYNREVFAVPGSIFSPASAGTNALIKRGAKVVSGVQDILEEFKELLPAQLSTSINPEGLPKNLSSEEETILKILTHEPLHIDKIIKITKLQTAQTSSLLSVLEIKGLAKDIGGMHYVRMNS